MMTHVGVNDLVFVFSNIQAYSMESVLRGLTLIGDLQSLTSCCSLGLGRVQLCDIDQLRLHDRVIRSGQCVLIV